MRARDLASSFAANRSRCASPGTARYLARVAQQAPEKVLEQLVLALREQGGLAKRGGVWEQSGPMEAVVPPLIRDVIGQRLDRLSPRCRSTLEMAAVLGQSVPHDLLLATLEADDEAVLLADLDEALGAQLLYETGGINSKIVPVVLSRADVAHIPLPLRGFQYYDLSQPAEPADPAE